VIVARAPLIVSFVASLFGYTIAEPAAAGQEVDATVSALNAIRPIFAAAIAIAVGEVVAWAVRRVRG
jgi:hypothetical protein